MKENMMLVTSYSDAGLVINVPAITFYKVWERRGAKLMIDRESLEEAWYYAPSVEYLFKSGLLATDDKQFLIDMGLVTETEDSGKVEVVKSPDVHEPVTSEELTKMLGEMSIFELKKKLKTMSRAQLDELGEYAVEHSDELKMDRIEIISEATGKTLMKAIANK